MRESALSLIAMSFGSPTSPMLPSLSRRVALDRSYCGGSPSLELGQEALELVGGQLGQAHRPAIGHVLPHLLLVPADGPLAAAERGQVLKPLDAGRQRAVRCRTLPARPNRLRGAAWSAVLSAPKPGGDE